MYVSYVHTYYSNKLTHFIFIIRNIRLTFAIIRAAIWKFSVIIHTKVLHVYIIQNKNHGIVSYAHIWKLEAINYNTIRYIFT